MTEFQRVLAVADLPPGGGVPVPVGDRTVAVFNVAGLFYAIDNVCPHRGGSLADGALIGTTVVCPLHRWNFDLTSGANAGGAGMGVEKFAVEIRDGDVYVAVPSK